MHAPTNAQLLGYWRLQLFWCWVVLSVGVGAFVGIAGPVASHVREGQEVVALSVPLLMLLMMLTGFAWLLAVMMFPPKWGTDKWGGAISTPPTKNNSRMRILVQA